MINVDTNRIIDVLKTVAERIKVLPADKVQSLEKTATEDDFMAMAKYQDTQAWAHAMGIISTAEGMWLYNIFGRECPSPDKFNSRTLPERIVALEWICALLRQKIDS